MDLSLTISYIAQEQYHAASLTLAWLIGGSLTGACSTKWLRLEPKVHQNAPLRVAGLLRAWAAAVPIAAFLRLVVPKVRLEETSIDTLAFMDVQMLAVDAAGLLFAVGLWRRVVLLNREWFL